MIVRRLCLLLLCLALPVTAVLAETSLWQVRDGERVMYLGGTVHVLAAADYPLPDEFDQAYEQADRLVFETDMQAINSPAFQLQMMQRLTYNDGRSLKDELGARAYGALQAYSRKRNLPMAMLEQFRPAMVSLVIVMTELERLGINGTGVDEHFYRRARNDGKAVSQLETPQAQLEFIAGMGQGQEDALILNSLRDAEQVAKMMSGMKAAWRSGDRAQLVKVGLEPMRHDYPGLYEDLLVKRNQAWLGKLERMLKDPDTELVLVGAMHLVGQEGLLEQLRARGYEIIQQ
ncbi:MAG TPA: TraB/GumN family protein [Gammaproteobacteria bacterium]|nr:TraB/GumN family protein [Gammaproteobacteria bacterium]